MLSSIYRRLSALAAMAMALTATIAEAQLGPPTKYTAFKAVPGKAVEIGFDPKFVLVTYQSPLVENLSPAGRVKGGLIQHHSRTFALNHSRDGALEFVQKCVVVIEPLCHD